MATTKMSITELDDDIVRSMSIGAVFSDFGGKINSLDFHRKDDLLVTASEDDSNPCGIFPCMITDAFATSKDIKTVGGDTAEVCDIKFSNDGKSMLLTTTNNNIYVLDAYGGEKRCGFSLEPSPNTNIEATFTPDGQYVISGSGDGTLHAWNINTRHEVAAWNSHIGVASCLKWAPRRAMFVAASTVLTFYIPNNNPKPAAEPGSIDTPAGSQSEQMGQ
ncbi:hypothetical protein COLO4_29099 [Corchorus olitorius]|uniref:Uncharacterized protein n=1 Tax=Corchorus olitorius TaxID=93759 RepID=A0A1R3HGC6_9ROSI|nr:hypothetical protein COLO4_29099 [Corchorus olitorius]